MADFRHHRPSNGQDQPPDPLEALAPKLRLAGYTLLWERIWPRLAPALILSAVLAGLAWLRVFDGLPDWLRLAAVGSMVAAILIALLRTVRVAIPQRSERLSRLEQDSGFDHRPLTALADRQVAGENDAYGRALWAAHLRRLAGTMSSASVRMPSPRLDMRDPYAIRAGVFLLFVIGLVAARGDWAGPIANAFRLPVTAGPEVRIDAWVTPPAYTGRPPVFLTAQTTPDGDAPAAPPARTEPLRVPEGTLLSIRVNGVEAPAARFVEGSSSAGDDEAGVALDAAAPQPGAATRMPADDVVRPTSFQATLDRSGTVILSAEGQSLDRFRFAVELDQAPSIKLVEQPAATVRGAFRLAYEAEDDYRVASARAVFDDPKMPLGPQIGGPSAPPRPLIDPPEFPLSLPRKGGEKKTAVTLRDLSAHPFAGVEVTMRLEAKDDGGNVGLSEPVAVVIPARPFSNPVAKMLVEQRRILALDVASADFVAETLDTVLDFSPEFINDASIHLGLRVLRNRVMDAQSDDDLRAALDMMWQMALAIDGGDASLAEQRLREAREQLRDALKNGASPEEIAKLTEELRKAMDEYMQALAEQMRNNPQLSQQNQQPDPSAQDVTPEDFQKMIDQIEQLSKLGDREAAEQLLSQLDQMLENLQTAQPNQGQQDGQQGQMQQQMNELADMIRRQQELMNQTHKMTPDGQPQDGEGMSQSEMEEALRQLQQGQSELSKRLQELMQGMQQNGMQPGDQLGQAQQSMKGAEGSLGEGEPGQALGQQGQALDQLRQGAQQLAEQMGQDGEGQGRQGRNAYSEDPLGRPQRREGPDFGDTVKVPGEIEVQRARRILEELRRRFSDQNRPSLELDYLQRLLTPF